MEDLQVVGIAIVAGLIGLFILRFVLKLLFSGLIIALVLGVFLSDYYMNYKKGKDTYVIKYIEKYIPMKSVSSFINETEKALNVENISSSLNGILPKHNLNQEISNVQKEYLETQRKIVESQK
jgi:purine-cytosine permease-like protein